RNPRWFFVVGVLLGVAMASKYTMLAAIIPIAAYCVIYCRNNQRSIPLKHIVLTIGCFLATLIIVDPAVWANPIGRLSNSFGFNCITRIAVITSFGSAISGRIPRQA